jgi:hypothetical protein
MSLEDLIEVGRLTPRDDPFDWDRGERRLQIRIPEDYRRLVDAGGSGLWFDYIRVFAPDERYLSLNLLDSDGVFEDLLIFWEDNPDIRPADFPEGDARLIAWASTAGGEMLFWRIEPGAHPDAYPIYVESADGDEWERFDMTTTDFLLGLQKGGVRSALFSEVFLDLAQTFRSYSL